MKEKIISNDKIVKELKSKGYIAINAICEDCFYDTMIMVMKTFPSAEFTWVKIPETDLYTMVIKI